MLIRSMRFTQHEMYRNSTVRLTLFSALIVSTAPLSKSIVTTLAFPWLAALCSGVPPYYRSIVYKWAGSVCCCIRLNLDHHEAINTVGIVVMIMIVIVIGITIISRLQMTICICTSISIGLERWCRWIAWLTLFAAFGLARESRSSFTTSTWPSKAAVCSGVAPPWCHVVNAS
jgi:hypothetical protein